MLWALIVLPGQGEWGKGGGIRCVPPTHHSFLSSMVVAVVAAGASSGSSGAQTKQGAPKNKTTGLKKMPPAKHTWKIKKPANKSNRLSMWKLRATGCLTWVSHSEAVLLCWPMFTLVDSWLNARKNKLVYYPASQSHAFSQKKNHHSQLLIAPSKEEKKKKKTPPWKHGTHEI